MRETLTFELLETRLRASGHSRAAKLLHNDYVRAKLTLPLAGGPPVVRLPSGRQVSVKRPIDLATLAEIIERLHHGGMVHYRLRLVGALGKAAQGVLGREDLWLAATTPYRKLHTVLRNTDEPKLQKKLLDTWDAYCRDHPGKASEQRWAESMLRRLGFQPSLYEAVERLQDCNVDGMSLDLLEVLHSTQPMTLYEQAPICKLLQAARLIPVVRRVVSEEGVQTHLLPVLAMLMRRLGDQPNGYDNLFDLVTADGTLPNASPRDVLRTLWRLGGSYDLPELRRGAVERTKALVLTPSPPAAPVRSALTRTQSTLLGEAQVDWAAIFQPLHRVDPCLPDDVMRSLLEAALERASRYRRYGLPEGEYWIICPDRVLVSAGIERLTFVTDGASGSVQAMTAPLPLRFALAKPPAHITGGPLLLMLVVAIMYEAMVTKREQLTSKRSQGKTYLSWAKESHALTTTVRKTVVSRIARHADRSYRTSNASRVPAKTASYVVPHLRWLRPGGQPGAESVSHAAEHGIRLPRGYTFVRGHVRGAGSQTAPREYTVAEIALETMARLRLQQQRTRRW